METISWPQEQLQTALREAAARLGLIHARTHIAVRLFFALENSCWTMSVQSVAISYNYFFRAFETRDNFFDEAMVPAVGAYLRDGNSDFVTIHNFGSSAG